MSWLDNLIIENANRMRIVSPICVQEDPLDSSSGGYHPNCHLIRMPFGISFGWNTMLMDRQSLGFVVAHEFAHVACEHSRWMCDSVSLSLLLRLVARIRRLVRMLPRSETIIRSSKDEFEADNVASEFYPKEALGRFLITSLAAIMGVSELREMGKVGGLDPIWDQSKTYVPDDGFASLSVKDACTIILSTFRADRNAFESCAARGRKEDEPEGYHPSIQDRLSNLGLEWDEMQASCDFRPELLLDMEEFCKWATPEYRFVSVPRWNGVSVAYSIVQ